MDDLAFIQRPQALNGIVERTRAVGFDMASEPRTGALLRTLAAAKPGGRLLELGTGTGMATAWLLAGMDAAASLTSVDTDATVQKVAREFLGQDQRLTLVNEDGAMFLRLQDQQSYDLIFADAMPGKYEALDEALALVRPGGFYVIDDMLPQPNWPQGHAEKIPVLLEKLGSDERFEVAPLVWSSGVVVAVRRAGVLPDNKN